MWDRPVEDWPLGPDGRPTFAGDGPVDLDALLALAAG
jgi:hypothetical protein